MSESGCLRNENVENLNVNGIILGQRRPIKLLTDKGGSGGAVDAITAAESGTIFLVPEITSANQTIQLPACANAVGCYYTFFLTVTPDNVDFDVVTPGSEKIIACIPDGAGNNTGDSAGKNSIGFDKDAVVGASFTLTCLSATDGHAWLAHDIIDSLQFNNGGINIA
tara:strand:+ start:12 stop:512 length:501 start_codon:yes stop_codon:yes gene_type:complete